MKIQIQIDDEAPLFLQEGSLTREEYLRLLKNVEISDSKKETRTETLDERLSYDDQLYARFQKLNEDLQRREVAFRNSQKVFSVVQMLPDGTSVQRHIQTVYTDAKHGLIVIVR